MTFMFILQAHLFCNNLITVICEVKVSMQWKNGLFTTWTQNKFVQCASFGWALPVL